VNDSATTRWDYAEVDDMFAADAHQDLSNECGFEYDRHKSRLVRRELSFYPGDTWLCRLELEPRGSNYGDVSGPSSRLRICTSCTGPPIRSCPFCRWATIPCGSSGPITIMGSSSREEAATKRPCWPTR
jgi:hypothetical protein